MNKNERRNKRANEHSARENVHIVEGRKFPDHFAQYHFHC